MPNSHTLCYWYTSYAQAEYLIHKTNSIPAFAQTGGIVVTLKGPDQLKPAEDASIDLMGPAAVTGSREVCLCLALPHSLLWPFEGENHDDVPGAENLRIIPGDVLHAMGTYIKPARQKHPQAKKKKKRRRRSQRRKRAAKGTTRRKWTSRRQAGPWPKKVFPIMMTQTTTIPTTIPTTRRTM